MSDLVCGDIDAHDSSWDDYASTDPCGSAQNYWMEAQSNVVLNDGSPTRAARGNQSAGISASDASMADTVMAHRFSCENIPEHGLDHFPSLNIWDKDIKVEGDHTRRRSNNPNADRPLIHKCLDNGIYAVLSVGSQSKRLEALCNLLKRAETEAVPKTQTSYTESPHPPFLSPQSHPTRAAEGGVHVSP